MLPGPPAQRSPLAPHVRHAPKRASKGTSKAKAPSTSRIIDIAAEAAAAAALASSKRSISADWDGSTITAEQLKSHRLALAWG